MKKLVFLLATFATILGIRSQETLQNHMFFSDNLKSDTIQAYFENKIENTQFIMLGEQHGIQEVGETTNMLFNFANKEGYNTLCIETSPFAAKILDLQFTSENDPEKSLKKLYEEHPYAIPFYNNKNDIALFKNVKENKGTIIGIDQTFMVEFRLIFDYLIHLNDNTPLVQVVKPLLDEAKKGFQNAITHKEMMALFLFKYTDELHEKLMSLTNKKEEKEILKSLKRTKEIYTYNFQKEYYKNNNGRAKLMKANFLEYYKEASQKEKLPKVLFKLGANHVGKGLNTTNVFDIANLVSEMAVANSKTSLHVYVMGVNGTKNIGNPFAPVSIVPFDNSNELPKELSEVVKNNTNKYIIIDAEKMRVNANSLPPKMKQLILKYDVLIYVKNCEALENLN